MISLNLIRLVEMLSDLEFHDGEKLGKSLGITRSAIWKIIQKLTDYGIEISSIKNKGYALKEPLLLLDQVKIGQEIINDNIELEIFETIESTNNYLKKNLNPLKQKICFAEMQTSGRGRMGRNWHSPFGQNIYMSYARLFAKDASELSGLSLIIGMACLNAIKEIGIDIPIKLKWPNDGIYLGQKMMGILVELQSESYGETMAIMGIGINVNALLDSPIITQEWTSLRKITGRYVNRNQLCIALIDNLNFYLEQFIQYGLREFIPKWQELDYLYNQKVKLNNDNISAIAKGIDQHGNLLLELGTGEIKAFSSGEISIQKN